MVYLIKDADTFGSSNTQLTRLKVLDDSEHKVTNWFKYMAVGCLEDGESNN